MEAKTVIVIRRYQVVPEGESRVGWLEKHGVVPTEFKVPVSADLKDWALAGVSIGDDGSISAKWQSWRNELEHALESKLRDNPFDLSVFDASDFLRDFSNTRQAEAEKRTKLASWVTENGENVGLELSLIRAAKEGRDVTSAMIDATKARIFAELNAVEPETVLYAITGDTYSQAPTTRAYAIRDSLVGRIDEIRKAAILPTPKVTISDFVYVDVAPVGEEVLRTGIEIKVFHPWLGAGNLGAHVLTEPLNYDPDDDDNDDSDED